MTKERYTTKTGAKQYRPVVSEGQYLRHAEGNDGFCLACGATVGGVEPDARRYTCEACDEPKVYGLEELLLMGLCRIKEAR